MKGGLLWLGVDYPFVHDLSLLVKLCQEKDSDFGQIEDDCIKLSPLYEEQRYPFLEEAVYSIEELEEFIKMAESIYGLVEIKMGASCPQSRDN